ncbi:hypothetical protein FA13DRAFT_1724161 [Coprinellus micaceus]|uniref:Uncharacterized protein n=1 Tax=Coprinellus micaceus TaxID=71717 RepID=A0A4Y7U272_COPMI|nr:hypothetical protein FA13DRAFT_1724161 [Coprinellus micaceus]
MSGKLGKEFWSPTPGEGLRNLTLSHRRPSHLRHKSSTRRLESRWALGPEENTFSLQVAMLWMLSRQPPPDTHTTTDMCGSVFCTSVGSS